MSNQIGQKFFNIGIIFLPWAVPIGLIFLFISLCISISKNYKEFLKDKNDYLIIIAIFLMIISAVKQNFYFSNSNSFDFNHNIYIGLFNWIPLLISFWGFKYYLKTSSQRLHFAKCLIIGSLPVLISCLGHKWLGWDSPITFLNGLIIWFQKPIYSDIGSGVSGLFSNPNYTGYWLATIFPFSIFFFYRSKKRSFKTINFLLVIIILYFTILSGSRNALLGIFVSALLFLKAKFFLLLFAILLSIILFDFLIVSIYPGAINFTNSQIIKNTISKIKFNFNNDLLQIVRFEIWHKTIISLIEKPFLGWGSSTFPMVYEYFKGENVAQHTHNIFLQLAFDYGLVVLLIISYIIFNLLFKSIKFVRKKNNQINLIDSFWIGASIVSVVFHQFDFPYYDIRISMLFWILLSGLSGICETKKLEIM